MLSDRILLSFGESVLLSGIGMLVVFLELVLLSLLILLLSKIIGRKKDAGAPADAMGTIPSEASAAAIAPSVAPAVIPMAPVPSPVLYRGTALINVDEPTAAVVMALVSKEMNIPVNRLIFHSIRGVPATHGVGDPAAAAVMAVVSDQLGKRPEQLHFKSIKKVN